MLHLCKLIDIKFILCLVTADKLEALKIRNLTKLARMLLTRTVIVYFPHMIDENHTCNAAFKMLAQYDQVQLAVVDQMEVQLTEESVPEVSQS